jgi:hypothetical protein
MMVLVLSVCEKQNTHGSIDAANMPPSCIATISQPVAPFQLPSMRM